MSNSKPVKLAQQNTLKETIVCVESMGKAISHFVLVYCDYCKDVFGSWKTDLLYYLF